MILKKGEHSVFAREAKASIYRLSGIQTKTNDVGALSKRERHVIMWTVQILFKYLFYNLSLSFHEEDA